MVIKLVVHDVVHDVLVHCSAAPAGVSVLVVAAYTNFSSWCEELLSSGGCVGPLSEVGMKFTSG